MVVTDFAKPFYLTDKEQALAKSAVDAIVHSGTVRMEPDGSLPDTVKNFIGMLNALAQGQPVTVIPRQTELTQTQAAEFLCVSEDCLNGLLDSGKIESRFVGGCRMAAMDSLLNYDEKETKRQHEAYDEVVRLSAEMGLYDD